MEKITFSNSNGEKLAGLLSGNDPNLPIVVMCHGFSSNKNSRTYKNLIPALGKKNISSFVFDFYGHGESDGDFAKITVSEAVDDLKNAITLIQEKGYTRIGLFGSSFGGLVVLLAIPSYSAISAIALKSPVSDFASTWPAEQIEIWKKKGYTTYPKNDGTLCRLNYSFFEDAVKHKAYSSVTGLQTPALIIHGDRDTVVPLRQSISTASLMNNCVLKIIKGLDHNYTDPKHFERMLTSIVDFLEQHLNQSR
ncbi:MAG: alpha/beta fold hydrolase [Candidatus Woesearchaeota archaeon]